jgi:hypothetical protein
LPPPLVSVFGFAPPHAAAMINKAEMVFTFIAVVHIARARAMASDLG